MGLLLAAALCLIIGFITGLSIVWIIGLVVGAVALILIVANVGASAAGPRGGYGRYTYGRWW